MYCHHKSTQEHLQSISILDHGPFTAPDPRPPVQSSPVPDARLPPGSCQPFLVQCSLTSLQPFSQRDSSICSQGFDHITPGGRRLQGGLTRGSSVSMYSVQFRTMAAESNRSTPSLFGAFYHGLCAQIKDEVRSEISQRISVHLSLLTSILMPVFEYITHSPGFPPQWVSGGSSDLPLAFQLGIDREALVDPMHSSSSGHVR